MKISARNVIKGTVKSVEEGAVNGHVRICRGNHNGIVASITNDSIDALGLKEGAECYAVIKASSIMVATEKPAGLSARNQFEGTVVALFMGAVNATVTIEDKYSQCFTASITNESVEQLGIELGCKAYAIIKSSDVMVAVD